MKCYLKTQDLAESVHYFLCPFCIATLYQSITPNRVEQHILHIHDSQDKNRAKIKPHTDGIKWRNT